VISQWAGQRGALVSDLTASLPPLWTFSRASSGTQIQSGVLSTAGTNVARFETSPAGYLGEPQGTNLLRNSDQVGAVAGSPGTDPTNWAVTGSSVGITKSIVGTGTENGYPYVDYRYVGTTTGLFQDRIYPDGTVGIIAAANGQQFTTSFRMRLVAGSTAGWITLGVDNQFLSSTQVFLGNSSTSFSLSTLGNANLSLCGFAYTFTVNQALTAFVVTFFYPQIPTATVVDYTIRVSSPQLEAGAIQTSQIRTTTAAATRAADNLTLDLTQLPGLQTATGYGAYLEFTVLSNAQTGVVFGMSAASGFADTWYFGGNGTTSIGLTTIVASAAVSGATVALATAGTVNRLAVSVSPAGIRWKLNGNAIQGVTNAGQPTMTTLAVGRAPWAASTYSAMHATSVTLAPGPQSDAWLSAKAY